VKENFQLNRRILFYYLPAIASCLVAVVSFLAAPEIERSYIVESSVSPDYPFSISMQVYFANYYIVQYGIYNLQILIYSWLLIRDYLRHKKNIQEQFSSPRNISLNWMLHVVILIILFNVYDILDYIFYIEALNESGYALFSVLYISLVGYSAARQKPVYSAPQPIQTQARKPIPDEQAISANNLTLGSNVPVQNSQMIAKELEKLMAAHKLFLNSELKLSDLSEQTGIHKNVLSKVINQTYKMNFFHWVNSYRVNECMRLIDDPTYNHFSMEGIARTAGFNSKSVFYPEFKRLTGITPTQYKEKNQKNASV
jgi:AraC-like DNA-binding protein